MSILCIGSAADRTFVRALRAMKRAGLAFDALELGQLAFSGEVEVPLDDLASAPASRAPCWSNGSPCRPRVAPVNRARP